MKLNKIVLSNFKNYDATSFDFKEKFNAFVGNNGVGKTNILDAIHYLCVAKSYFHHNDKLNVKNEQDFFRIEGLFEKDEKKYQIVCKFSLQTKKIVENNSSIYTKLAEHIGLFPLVMISPDDIKLINEGGEDRRKFIDFSISQLNRDYLNSLIAYNSLLQQKNSLLKNFNNNYQLLKVYNLQMAVLANYIYKQRVDFFELFIPIFNHFYKEIAHDKEFVELVYHSDLQNNDILQLWDSSEQQDIFLQRTTKGIHKDDFTCLLFGQNAKVIGSQGQKKSFLLSLKLAQYQLIVNKTGLRPLLLLDDIFDKLDRTRVKHLLVLVSSDNFGQVFITDTDLNRIKNVFEELGVNFGLFGL